ncbi:MAG TPA: biopolymer transporter ExbD, partial [Terriglobales bacterium]
ISALVASLAGFTTFSDLGVSKGLVVTLDPERCEVAGANRVIFLRIAESGKVFLNNEPLTRSNLAGLLSELFSKRERRTLHVLGHDQASFQTIADVIDIVGGVQSTTRPGLLDIEVRLVTPATVKTGCIASPSQFVPIRHSPK